MKYGLPPPRRIELTRDNGTFPCGQQMLKYAYKKTAACSHCKKAYEESGISWNRELPRETIGHVKSAGCLGQQKEVVTAELNVCIRNSSRSRQRAGWALLWDQEQYTQFCLKDELWEAVKKEEMKIPWKDANEGPPISEEQYQERFWRRRLDGIGLDTARELLTIEFKRTARCEKQLRGKGNSSCSRTQPRFLGWRIHCGVEVTELSTNKQHSLSLSGSRCQGDYQKAQGHRPCVGAKQDGSGDPFGCHGVLLGLRQGGGADLIVPGQDWATRFTELQGMFPPWVLALITNFPDSFTNIANCWAAIIAEASSQAAGRKMGAGGRFLQLAADTMPVGELDGMNDVTGALYDYPPD